MSEIVWKRSGPPEMIMYFMEWGTDPFDYYKQPSISWKWKNKK